MTAKNQNLTFLTVDGGIKRQREALMQGRGPDLKSLSDEEVQTLWTSLDPETRREYLGEEKAGEV